MAGIGRVGYVTMQALLEWVRRKVCPRRTVLEGVGQLVAAVAAVGGWCALSCVGGGARGLLSHRTPHYRPPRAG